MEITIHGHSRIYDRTKMHPEDVLLLIENNAVVSLGFDKKVEFLLFYSPQERVGKIAVVSDDRSALISIFGPGYGLPKGVLQVTFTRFKKARKLFFDFLKTRGPIVETSKPAQIVEDQDLFAHIEVLYSNRKPEYVHKPIQIVKGGAKDLSQTVVFLRGPLTEISSVVAESLLQPDRVRYNIVVRNKDQSFVRQHCLKHGTLIRHLSTA